MGIAHYRIRIRKRLGSVQEIGDREGADEAPTIFIRVEITFTKAGLCYIFVIGRQLVNFLGGEIDFLSHSSIGKIREHFDAVLWPSVSLPSRLAPRIPLSTLPLRNDWAALRDEIVRSSHLHLRAVALPDVIRL